MSFGTIHQLILEPLDDVTWRLCDRAVPENEARNVVACVERVAPKTFEVTWLVGPPSVDRLASLEDVLSAAVRHLREAPPAPPVLRAPRRRGHLTPVLGKATPVLGKG